MILTPKKDFDEKWGFVDETGTWIVTPLYDRVEPFVGNYARAYVSGQYIFIDKTGRWFKEIPTDENAEEDHIYDFSEENRSVSDIIQDGFSKISSVLHKGLKYTE